MQTLQARKSRVLTDQLLGLLGLVAQSGEPRAMAVAADLDLSLSQLRALLALWRDREPVSLGALARAIGLSDAAAGRMVDTLVRSELVIRREDENDRRVKRITLAPAGERAVDGLAAAKREGLDQLVERFLPDELDRLSEALSPILERLAPPTPNRS